jgi:hypothetical protein
VCSGVAIPWPCGWLAGGAGVPPAMAPQQQGASHTPSSHAFQFACLLPVMPTFLPAYLPSCLPVLRACPHPIHRLPASPSCPLQALQVPKVALLFLTRGDLFHAATWHAWLAAAADLLPAEQLHAATCASAFADTKGSAEGGRVRQPGHRTQQKKVAAAPAAAPTLAAAAPVAELEPGPGLGLLGQRGAVEQAPRWLLQPAALAAACGWTVGGGAVPPTNSGSGSVIDRQHLFSVYVHAPPNVTGGGWESKGGVGPSPCMLPLLRELPPADTRAPSERSACPVNLSLAASNLTCIACR